MRVTWNVDYSAVIVTVVAGARQCEIQARVTFVEATIQRREEISGPSYPLRCSRRRELVRRQKSEAAVE